LLEAGPQLLSRYFEAGLRRPGARVHGQRGRRPGRVARAALLALRLQERLDREVQSDSVFEGFVTAEA
jgi:hypothetical protein